MSLYDMDIVDMRAAQAAQRRASREASAAEVLVIDGRDGIRMNPISQDVPMVSSAPMR